MIEKLKKLCRLICISVLIGILLFPGQVMADTGENSCRVTLPVSVIYRNQNSADRRVLSMCSLQRKAVYRCRRRQNFVLQYQMEWAGFVWNERIYGTRRIPL